MLQFLIYKAKVKLDIKIQKDKIGEWIMKLSPLIAGKGTIRRRILVSTLSLIILFSIVTACIGYYIVSMTLENNIIHTSETKLTYLSSSIDSNVNNVLGYVNSCQKSTRVRNYAMEKNVISNSKKVAALDYMTDAYSANSALFNQLIRFVVVGNNRDDIIQIVSSTYSTSRISAEKIKNLEYLKNLEQNNITIYKSIDVDPFMINKYVQMIPFACIIESPYSDEKIGYAYGELSTSVITDPIKNYLSNSDSRIFIEFGNKEYEYENGELVLCNENYEIVEDKSQESLREDTIIYEIRSRDKKEDLIMVKVRSDIDGLYVSEILNRKDLNNNIFNTFMFLMLLIVLFASASSYLLAKYLNKTVNDPVKKLQERMERIEKGDFSRDKETEWDHELGQIGKDINDLSENVLNLMNQRIEDERQKNDYEYRMLQSQINPHFLYNTLNSIKWMATIQNAPGIAEMTTALSRLLKDISKGTSNLVSINHEISLIKDYFTIQQYRYGGTISLNINIEDDTILKGKILKFTMQPIVENAIFHGIEPKGTAGKITIHSYYDKEDVVIDITDDGVGMDEEMLSTVLENDKQTKSAFFKEIGVSNVHKRLKYEFGEGYGLSIDSKLNEYTTIKIRLPYVICEEENMNV